MIDNAFALDKEERQLVGLLLARLQERSACWHSVANSLNPREIQVMANATKRLAARLERYDRTPRLPLLLR